LGFGKVERRRLPDFGKAVFSEIWAFFGGYSGRCPALGGGKPPKGAASRPAEDILVRMAHCFEPWASQF